MIKCYGNNFVDDLIKNNGEKPYHIFMIKTKNKIKEIKEFTNYYVAYDYVDNIKTKE